MALSTVTLSAIMLITLTASSTAIAIFKRIFFKPTTPSGHGGLIRLGRVGAIPGEGGGPVLGLGVRRNGKGDFPPVDRGLDKQL